MKKVGMFLVCILLVVGGFWFGSCYVTQTTPLTSREELQKLKEDLSSPEGLMRMIPQLKNASGAFEIPNPNVDLETYLLVRQSLLNIIEMALTRANLLADPYAVEANAYTPLKLPTHWNATEVGFITDAKTIPNFSQGGFGYAGKSFLDGVMPVQGTNESFYTVPGSVVYMHIAPTSLSCVNRIMETSGLNGGTMISTSYVLGRKDGTAYLIVNGCQNTAKTITVNGQQVLAPGASSFLGMQWVK